MTALRALWLGWRLTLTVKASDAGPAILTPTMVLDVYRHALDQLARNDRCKHSLPAAPQLRIVPNAGAELWDTRAYPIGTERDLLAMMEKRREEYMFLPTRMRLASQQFSTSPLEWLVDTAQAPPSDTQQEWLLKHGFSFMPPLSAPPSPGS
ncbi:MAG: hypothetical protein GC129_05860 [Proteobacteria bacterium]|nr:hypothetical protein [Pseudomonadota bacterium]